MQKLWWSFFNISIAYKSPAIVIWNKIPQIAFTLIDFRQFQFVTIVKSENLYFWNDYIFRNFHFNLCLWKYNRGALLNREPRYRQIIDSL